MAHKKTNHASVSQQNQKEPMGWMILSDLIINLSVKADKKIDRMNVDLTLTKAMTEENRVDMKAFIDRHENSGMSAMWVLGNVVHDIKGFTEEFLSAEPTGFSPRTGGYAKAST